MVSSFLVQRKENKRKQKKTNGAVRFVFQKPLLLFQIKQKKTTICFKEETQSDK